MIGKTFNKWNGGFLVLFSFVAGMFLSTLLIRGSLATADSHHLFELRVYHTMPGKLPVMESRFRDTTSKLLAKHNLNVVGYWVTPDASAETNSFVFLLAHDSQEEAKKNWDALRLDPDFKEVQKAELLEKTLDRADVIYLRPTDFSPLQ
ncbi:MAG TPA: NIPSNAP family protein [Acidobacteriota bacterium]|nr:NIPSNAP family protein [Acidobacteriota bacterium]